MKKPIILQKIPVVSLALALTVSLSLPSVSSAATADLQINSFLEAQQALTIEAAPAFISPELSTDSSRQVRVIVQLDGEPLAVDNMRHVQASKLSQLNLSKKRNPRLPPSKLRS